MAKTINLNNPEVRRTFTVSQNKKRHCSHNHIEVDETERIIECSDCEKRVDAFDFIMSLAHKENRHFWRLDEIKRMTDVLENEMRELQRRVKNLKAQERRLKKFHL